MKKFILIIPLCLLGIFADAQQLPQVSQYYLNPYSVNPAATGINEMLPLAFTFRKSYAGLQGAPSFQLLSGHMSVYENMGAGLKVYNYQTGPERKTGVDLTYSYHIEFNDETHLSLGLSGVLYQYYLNKSDLSIENPDDPAFLGADSKMVIDANFGTYLYGSNYYVGLAVPQLINRSIDPDNEIVQQRQVRHYYLHAGYDYEANRDLTLSPAMLLKFVEAGIFQADIQLRATYQDMFSLGLAYRTSDAFVVHLGFKYEEFLLGYAIDFVLSDISAASFASHEITLLYSLNNFIR